MKVVVASPTEDCVAHRALLAEGVPHTVERCWNEGYSARLAELWREGEGFVLLERDIVPWVGAIRQLKDCDGDWCSFRYAFHGSTVRSLGLVKFSERLVRSNPNLSENWDGKPWPELEAALLGAVGRLVTVCKHHPAVGRARGLD